MPANNKQWQEFRERHKMPFLCFRRRFIKDGRDGVVTGLKDKGLLVRYADEIYSETMLDFKRNVAYLDKNGEVIKGYL